MQNNTNNRQYEPRDFGLFNGNILVGRTTKPAMLRYTKTGKPVINLDVVVTRRVVERDENRQVITDRYGKAVVHEDAKFVRLVLWPHERRAQWLADNLNVPGFVILAEGRVEASAYMSTKTNMPAAQIELHSNDMQVLSFPRAYNGPTTNGGGREETEYPDWGYEPDVPQQPQGSRGEPSLEDLFNGV